MSDSTSKSPTNTLTDFSDRLSPVLVKELRQGLRTNMFVLAFILLQAFLVLCLMMGQPGDASTSDTAFWSLLVIVFIFVQPLRGFSSLSTEFAYNTMDLIQLTRLNALRITLGKWTALNAQSLLMFISVLPYLVMRYFYGAVDIISDFKYLLGIAYCSALLSAIAVGSSAFKQLIPRLILLIASVWAFGVILFQLLAVWVEPADISLFIYAGIVIGAYFLLLGSSKIAPQSENHSTLKRLIGLIGALGTFAFIPFVNDGDACFLTAIVIIVIAAVDAMTEKIPIFHGVLPKFSGNHIKHFFSKSLTPGWHTGFRFTMIAMLIVSAMGSFFGINWEIHEPLLLFSGLTFPLLIIHLFFAKSKIDHLGLYIAIQAGVFAIAFLMLPIAENLPMASRDIAYLLFPVPAVLATNKESVNDEIFLLLATAGWCVLIIVVMYLVSRKPFNAMRAFFKSYKN